MDKRKYNAPLTETLAVESMPLLNDTSKQYFERGTYDTPNNIPEPDSDNMVWGD